MDVRAQLLEPLLVAHAEMLLLVDDQKAQVLETDPLGQQRMCAHDNIDGAACDSVAGGLRLLGADETRQRAHLQRKAAKTLGKTFEMLPRQQGRGGDHRHLHARHGRDKGRAHRHFGLAKAHIAANQPVHRIARAEIGQDILDRAQLIIGLHIGKARAERLPGVMLRLQHGRGSQGTLCRHPDQAFGHLADTFLEPCLLGLPGAAAQLVQKPFLMAELAEQFDILDRQVKF